MGQIFETLVVTEVQKWLKTAEFPVDLAVHPLTAIQRLDHQIWSIPVDRLLV